MPLIFWGLLSIGGTGWLLGKGAKEAGEGANEAGNGSLKIMVAVAVAVFIWIKWIKVPFLRRK